MRTEREIMELYNQYEYLVEVNVNRFYNNREYHLRHGLDKDDLMQYGRLGLYRACKEYDKSVGKTFRNFAINHIRWSIQNETKNDSVSGLTKKTTETVERVSLDAKLKISDDEDAFYYDMIESPELGYSEVEANILLDSICEAVTDDRVKDIVKLRMQGYTFKEVGSKMSISSQRAYQILNESKNIIKNAIM